MDITRQCKLRLEPVKGLRPERTSAGGGDCLPKPNSSSKVQFVEYVAEWEYLWGSAARGRDWLGLPNSAENQCDRRLWELVDWLFIEVFYRANMEAVEDLARSGVPKSVPFKWGKTQSGHMRGQRSWGSQSGLGQTHDSQFHAGGIKRGDGQITIRVECSLEGRRTP